MSTITAKIYDATAAVPAPEAQNAGQTSAAGLSFRGLYEFIELRVRTYFRNQSELKIERMIAENGGKLTDNIEREITRRLGRNY
jgi:hypothetical protein